MLGCFRGHEYVFVYLSLCGSGQGENRLVFKGVRLWRGRRGVLLRGGGWGYEGEEIVRVCVCVGGGGVEKRSIVHYFEWRQEKQDEEEIHV